MYKLIKYFFFFILLGNVSFAQFGQNKVQYKNFTWYYIQTDHFDIYFSQNGATLAEFTAKAAEDALRSIQKNFKYKINNRITVIVYNSTNDFQETNVTDEYLTEGIEGFTELFKNRVVVQFTGSYKKYRHLVHHELVHAVMNDMFYGGSLQNIISNNININLPLWFSEGMAEYLALGWDIDTDMFIRDAAISEYLPDIERLGGYFAYRGGQSIFYYISKKYGKEKIAELVNKVRGAGSLDEGLKASIGLNLEELNERWKKDIKKRFWPDISIRKDADEFAKRLTDPKDDGGFYNISPAISPQGDKIAFISNRDYYFDVFLMNAIDGKVIKKLVSGNRSADFEELNVLNPGLTWSPDGKKIALSAKSSGWDVVYIIDVESEDKETLPFEMDGIQSISWSFDGSKLSMVAHNADQSDVYLYDFNSKKLENLTNDIFTEVDPAWSLDGRKIFFASDRNDNLSSFKADSIKIYNHDYKQSDIYYIDIETKNIVRVTDLPSDETSPVPGADDSEILYISDENGINNIYKKQISGDPGSIIDSVHIPITNSLSGLYQLSLSRDTKKLVFSTLYEASYNLFLLNNPFEIKLDTSKIEPTLYIKQLKENKLEEPEFLVVGNEDDSTVSPLEFYTGSFVDTTKVYGDSVQIDFNNYVFGEKFNLKPDTLKNDNFELTDNLDTYGNYKVNKYKIAFSPDLIYANAGYSTLYGLLGTTVLSFSDVLGNHRIIGVTSLQIDLKNSDYGLAYYYLPGRLDYGFEAFHTARFVFLSRGINLNLFRFRNFGAIASISYPLNRFYRVDGGLSFLNVSSENLDNPGETEKVTYLIPTLSFIHDNILWGYTSPIDGTRYRLDVLGNPGISKKRLSFYSAIGDFRTYFRFWYDYSFGLRLSTGVSGGKNPQRFFIGGIENWINRRFATGDIPINSASDFAFLTAVLPMRGFDYAEKIGSKYALMNMELRFPLIRYLVTGALPILFSNILGVAFVDIGTAWDNNKDLVFFTRNHNGNIISKDLLMGTGVGARIFLFYFLLRFDVAWSYNVDSFSRPKFYFSLGADF